MSRLGIYASQISGHLANYAFESIATVTVGSAVSSVSFSSIPSTYKHLQIRFIGRSTRSANQGYIVTKFNSDTGNNYAMHSVEGDGSATATSAFGTFNGYGSFSSLYEVPAATAGANMYGAGVIDILDYQNTNKATTTRALQGDDKNGSGRIYLASGLWTNTAAINTITFTEFNGANIDANSKFALYGVKG